MKKYGRTFHLPISLGATDDDKIMASTSDLEVADLVVTEKMDGENTTIHAGGCHARSPDSRYHPSRDWVKAFAAAVSPSLAADERIVGENVFARHAIPYDSLDSYFLGFAWIVGDRVQSWDDTLGRFDELGVCRARTLYRGAFYDGLFEELASGLDLTRQEGFVARCAASFAETDMPKMLGKYVRANHVQTDVHWTQQPLVPNKMRKD